MPDSNHPPYVSGSITQPRTLNRWLDVNAQNGPLGRTQSYITLPMFSQAITWRGYSEIAIAFNFEGPNNFSLKSNFTAPVSPNYMLCIMWEDSAKVTHRYALWSGVGEVIYFDVPLYTGQLIKKNFRLEVWTTNSSPSVNTTALNFFTSVLGNSDYRYGTDFQLISSDAPVTVWGENNVVPALPNDANNLLLQRFVATNGFVAPDWNSINAVATITSIDSILATVETGPDNFSMVQTIGAPLTGGVSASSNYIYIVCYLTGAIGNLVNFNGGPSIGVGFNTITVGGVNVLPLNTLNTLYLIAVNFVDNAAFIQEIYTQLSAFSGIAPAIITGSTTLTALSAATTNGILEVFSYQSLANFQGVNDYIFRRYGGFPIPFVFPNNNAPTVNS